MSPQQREFQRINELIEDGFLERCNQRNTVVLTRRGMKVLFACADRPLIKDKLNKPTLVIERQNTQKGLKKSA